MDLKHLTDKQLILDLQNLIKSERELLIKILYHLKEVEKRKLYSDYNCSSLFDYACKELKYSADQACRRIQAMRVLKEIPEAAAKINSGELSLTNINQAQRYFNENKVVSKTEKIVVLKTLMNKSTREGQKELLKLSPIKPLPLEIKKQVSPSHTYTSFNMSEELEAKLSELKSLLGPNAYNLKMSELIEIMADMSLENLKQRKFGKKRSIAPEPEKYRSTNQKSATNLQTTCREKSSTLNDHGKKNVADNSIIKITKKELAIAERLLFLNPSSDVPSLERKLPKKSENKNPRNITAKIKHQIWIKNGGSCIKCKSTHNLQYDHIKPLALGGSATSENLRLLCFHCNQRQRISAGLIRKVIQRRLE